MRRARQHDQLVGAERNRLEPLVGRLKRQDTEIEAAFEQLGRNLPRRHAPDLDARLRVLPRKRLEQGQQGVNRRLVGANHDASPAHLLQLAYGRFRLRREPEEPRGVLPQENARLGQRAVSGRPVEELVPELVFQPPDGLADSRLRAVESLGRLRKAPVGGDGNESVEVLQLHPPIIRNIDIKAKTINWTQGWPSGTTVSGGLMSTNRLTIFDTTLRDGEQAPGFSMRVQEKLTLARQLATLGVDVIEAGFPIASEADAEAVRTIATEVKGTDDCRPRTLQPG